MIVVVIIGILAAVAIPNFEAMQDRAYEASVKSNGHTTQLAVEDLAVQANGVYPHGTYTASAIKGALPGGVAFSNPFGGQYGLLVAAKTADEFDEDIDGVEGTVVYYPPAPGSGMYIIACYGHKGNFILKLSNS